MRCPSCDRDGTRVIDSRTVERGAAIRRRRGCPACGHRFSTVEQVELLRLVVVKKDGRREPYDRKKLENGIRKALEKRPVPEAHVRELVATLERKLQGEREEEIPSRAIGALVMRHLKALDEVAYIRFASVYKSFRDAETFGTELERLKKRNRGGRRISRPRRRVGE